MERLFELFHNLLNQTSTTFLRYLHEEIDWSNRLIAIVGARGVGKTTLLLQHIKLNLDTQTSLYINADDIYFAENRLFDLASSFYKNGGKHFFIDEIHKYKDWSKEVKMMYDYFPDLQIIFTGSSILDIYKGSDDLSRRAISYHLPGMSFREYLNLSQGISLPAYSLEEITRNRVKLQEIQHPLPLFKEYLKKGYYPFFKESSYEVRLQNILTLILETDIPIHANLTISTSKKIKQLLYIISQSVPFKPVFIKIADKIDVHRNQIVDFFFYLEKVQVISQLRNPTKGIQLLGKIEKVYLNNPNLIYALAEDRPDIGNIRETFFFNQLSVKNNVFSSPVSDFLVNDFTFEVGGKGKGQKQIEGMKNAFVVKDDIEIGYGNVVPLWAFGFNY